MISNNRITHTDKNGNTSTQTVSSPTYDVFGNVIADNRPGTAADMAYTYDTLHGWLTGVSSPSGFSEQLQRETATNTQYGGNIGRMLWRNTANGEQHRYDYTYDSLGRLTSSQYSSSANGTAGRYNESVTYNPNGSIMSLLRKGMKNDGTFDAIDDLTITYDGNRLLKVTDDAEALNYNGALDFHDGSDEDCEYEYDGNGALTKDKNRGITGITYDYGHNMYHASMVLPSVRGGVINDYNSDGRKLSSRHTIYTPTGHGGYNRIVIADLYIDGLILRNDTTLLWKFNGGYVELNANGTPTSWNYYITDHLGSTRMVVDSNNNIKETINYYPFGSEMKMEDPALLTGGTSHPYRFTGKELDKMIGLNMYDFGARWYDVAGVPMWTSVDPLAEKYYNVSPYNYCGDNPVNRIDPNGRDVWEINGQGYLVNYIKTDEYDRISYVNSQGEVGVSVQFDYGIVSYKTIKNNRGDYDIFTIGGDKNGSSIFEMLAQNTDVEWTLGQFGEKGIGINRITTTHSNWSEGGMTSYLYENPSQVMELRNIFHNHPDGNPDPSFTSREGGIGGDMNVLHYYDQLYPDNHINYAIYTLYAGTWGYYPYDKNTKPDAIRGKQTELPEIFVPGKRR